MPPAHLYHRPGNPPPPGPTPVVHRSSDRKSAGLVPLAAPASENGPALPPPSPLETTKGTVLLEGQLKSRSYETQSGETRFSLDVSVSEIQFLEKSEGKASQDTGTIDDADDLTF